MRCNPMTLHQTEIYRSSSREDFIEAMSRSACTVNVVATDGIAGRAGVTVTAMSSVTADLPKPELLVCVDSRGSACAAILENRVFCVNVLNSNQREISDMFAGRSGKSQSDRFSLAHWRLMQTGSPRLVDPLAAFDCSIVRAELYGSHYVIVGAVEETFISNAGSALIYVNRDYREIREASGH